MVTAMTPREQALLLRLCACELTQETRSIIVLRRILHDLGWTDAAMDAAVVRARAALVGVRFVQSQFDVAA
jgi:hypothetical protein